MKNKNNIPLFKSWKHWYIFIVAILVVNIFLFILFTNYFI